MSHPPADFSSALEGRYRIERELGSGGMATVYLATDVRHGRNVAVKVLRPEIAAAVGADRFLAEIRTTANLQHPHILGLIDSGAVAGQVFYVMPFVSGETLRDRLRDEKLLPIADAVRIATQVASALDYAHRQGVIHRDIKPANILLQDGQAIVADFGIAMGVTRAGGNRLTESGIALGTPAYMSPEQAMGERDLTVGADVFALGCVLYEMLTGETPFSGPTAQAIAAKVMNAEPAAITSLRRSVPAHVATAVHTALQKLPADRFTSAQTFAEVLAGTTAILPAAPDRGATVGRRNRWAAAIVLIAAGIALGWMVRGIGARAAEPTLVSHHSIILPGGTLFSTYPRPWGLALSPDGGTIVYSASVDRGHEQLFVKRPGDLDAVALTGTEGGIHPFFSPDGLWVAFLAEGALKKVSLTSGSVETITRLHGTFGWPGTWADDGTLLFSLSTDGATVGIASVASTGGPVTMLSRPGPGSGEPWHLGPQRLPGTNMVMYTATSAAGNARVMARPLGGGAEKLILDRARSARYLGNDRIIYEVDGELFTARFDLPSLVVSEPTRVPIPVARHLGGRAWDATRDVLVYRAKTSRALVWVRRDGLRTRLGFPPKDYSTPVLSPGGDRLAVIAGDDDRSDVWIGDLRREIMTRLSSDGLSRAGLLWTPDGERLTLSRFDGGPLSLYSVRADGSGGFDALLRNGKDHLWAGGWTRDSRALIVMQGDTATSGGDLLLLDLTHPGTPQPLVQTPASEWGGRLSPDQRWLAYFSDFSGRYELYVTAFPGAGRRWQISREGGGEVVWSRDGRELFFRSGSQVLAVTVKAGATFDWDPPKVLFEGSYYFGGGPGLVHYDVSPDGSRFLMIEDDSPGVPRFNVVRGWDHLMTAGAGSSR